MTTWTEADQANTRAFGSAQNAENDFAEFLTLKALTAKRNHLITNPFGANMMVLGCSHKKGLTRNLCVRLDLMTLLRIEAITEVLDTNKQEIVVEALNSGIKQAERAIKSAGITGIYEELMDRKFAAAGFSFDQSPHNEDFYVTKYKGEMIFNHDHERQEQAAEAWSGAAKGVSDIIGEMKPDDADISDETQPAR